MTKAILAILIVITIIQVNLKAYGAEPVFSSADNNKQIVDKIIGTHRSDKSYEEYLQSNSDLNFVEWESQKQQRRKNVGIALTAVGGSMAIVGGTLALTVPRSCDEGDLECSLKSFIITAGTSGISVLAIMVPGIILTILSNKRIKKLLPFINNQSQSAISFNSIGFKRLESNGLMGTIGFTF